MSKTIEIALKTIDSFNFCTIIESYSNGNKYEWNSSETEYNRGLEALNLKQW